MLEEANKQIEAASYSAAWTCADRAADLSPQSVEANHLRAAALAGMGRDGEAQVAYQLALALDPDDPETLRAVADFYINGKGERGLNRNTLAGGNQFQPLFCVLSGLRQVAEGSLAQSRILQPERPRFFAVRANRGIYRQGQRRFPWSESAVVEGPGYWAERSAPSR